MCLVFPIKFAVTRIDGYCYRVIDSSILQDIFSSVLKFLSCNEEKTVRKHKKININIILKISKLCVMRLTQIQQT